MKRRVVAVVVLMALFGAGCSNGTDRDVLATVDGAEITIDELVAYYTVLEDIDQERPGPDALADFGRAGALSIGGPGVAFSLGTLIQIEAVREEAQALGIETPVLDSQRAIDEDIPIFLGELLAAVPDQLEVDELVARLLEGRSCSRHILVTTEAEADDALARVESGEDLAVVAVEVSIDSGSAARGGELGCHDLANFDPAFAAGLFVLEVGDRSGVVESSFGFHIIERVDPPDETLAEADREARNQILQRWFNDRALESVVELDPAVGVWSGTNISAADPGANS